MSYSSLMMLAILLALFANHRRPSSLLATTNNDRTVGASQQQQQQQQVNENGCACFEDRFEMKDALDQFYGDGFSDENNCNNNVVQKYGWPIGSWWCVSNVTSMYALFNERADFNDDISA